MVDTENQRLAVMIDADNAQASLCAELLAEVARFGVASVKRAYGDWTTTRLKGWKDHLHRHAIQPIQQFSYTTGKNATDSALIIDAMDLLHEGKLDGFCLVSSDSDFTRLATRIRESGLTVYGFGERKTPEPFVSACDKFIYTEILKDRTDVDEPQAADAEQTSDLRDILIPAVNTVSRDDGWAPLSGVGDYLNKKYPSFDPRNYGYQKLGQLMRSLDYITVEERKPQPDSPSTHIYVKATG